MKTLSNWENNTGIDFLKKIGIKKGYKVLDFGANDGNYTIPASAVVGKNGTVFAIDENESALKKISEKSKLLKYDNIKLIKTNGKFDFNFNNNFVNFVMCYDVLHYLNSQKRVDLYKEIYRILKKDAIFSVHPKHIIDNWPMMEFKNVTLDELIDEIEKIGFKFKEKISSKLIHDSSLENGYIINFVK